MAIPIHCAPSEGCSASPPQAPLAERHDDAKLHRALEQARITRLKLIDALSDPFERREYYLTGVITQQAASDLIGTVDHWWRIDSMKRDGNRTVRIIINSSSGDAAGAVNGSFIATLAIYDFLRLMKLRGFTVEVQVLGHASYHAAVIVQAASDGRRLAGPRSYLFLEGLKNEFSATSLEAEHRIRWITQLQEQYNRLVSQRSEMSAADFAAKIDHRAWCVNAKEARQLGLIDEIIDGPSIEEVTCLVQPPLFEADDPTDVRLKKAELVRNEADATMLRLEALQKETSDDEACIHRLFTGVDTESCRKAMAALRRFGTRCNRHMKLIINSPGGRIVDGLGVFDQIKALQSAGHKVDTICVGYAASMGGVLLQAGTERIIGAESWILVHRASGWFGGTTEEILDQMKKLERLQDECFKVLSSRTGKKLKLADVRKRCDRGDWWVKGDKAKPLGLVDKVF